MQDRPGYQKARLAEIGAGPCTRSSEPRESLAGGYPEEGGVGNWV